MPPSLRSPTHRSLGHFKRTLRCRACATDRPTASDKPDQSCSESANPSEKVSEALGCAAWPGACASAPWLLQWRPKRPRPAVWRSATSSTGSARPRWARRISSVLVDSSSGRISTLKPGKAGSTACQMASAGHSRGGAGTAAGMGGVKGVACAFSVCAIAAAWGPAWCLCSS